MGTRWRSRGLRCRENLLKTLHIHRFAEVADGIIGRTSTGLYTMENDLHNFPAGDYDCTLDYYHTGGYQTYLIDVPNRSRILFHKGNTEDDSRGCILLGKTLDVLNGKIAVAHSGTAFSEFMEWAEGKDYFKLIITAQ